MQQDIIGATQEAQSPIRPACVTVGSSSGATDSRRSRIAALIRASSGPSPVGHGWAARYGPRGHPWHTPEGQPWRCGLWRKPPPRQHTVASRLAPRRVPLDPSRIYGHAIAESGPDLPW